MKRYDYQVIESFCEELDVTTYGLSICAVTGTQIDPYMSIKGISSDWVAITRLAEQCQRLQLDPIHLLDVIEDFLS